MPGSLLEAALDYHLLLDRGYPVKATVALVGDRHRLDAAERAILFRGVHATAVSRDRAAKLSRPSPGAILLVDLYNVAFTIVHRIIGKPCFISSDGLLRDAGANYGRVPHEAELARAFDLVAAALANLAPCRVEAFLDAPVSRSGAHAEAFRSCLASAGFRLEGEDPKGPFPSGKGLYGEAPEGLPAAPSRASPPPDGGKAPQEPTPGMTARVEAAGSADGAIQARLASLSGQEPAALVFVASSDSVLVDRASHVFDLARLVIEESLPGAGPLPDEFLSLR